jgi:hypothetical protein
MRKITFSSYVTRFDTPRRGREAAADCEFAPESDNFGSERSSCFFLPNSYVPKDPDST